MAIYTKFGTLFTLTTPVDWNTGWVNGWREGDKVVKEYHVSDLRADEGLNEIQAASDALEPRLCRDCGLPMEVQVQPQRDGAKPLLIVTCKNKTCGLWGVTLSTTQYAALNEEQWSGYRKIVKGLKARFGMEVQDEQS